MSGKKGVRQHKYTEEEKAFLKEFVPGHSHKEIREAFNLRFNVDMTLSQIKGSIKRYGLNTGHTGRFEKGHPPMNKGKKLSPEMYKIAEPTMFRKDHRPHNTLPVGTEKKLADGYWWKKLTDKPNVKMQENWKQMHRLIWEEHNGPIPEGHYIIFKDGNRDNLDIDNLVCVSKRVHCQMCKQRLYSDDPDLTETGLAIAKLRDMIATKRNEKNEQQN